MDTEFNTTSVVSNAQLAFPPRFIFNIFFSYTNSSDTTANGWYFLSLLHLFRLGLSKPSWVFLMDKGQIPEISC